MSQTDFQKYSGRSGTYRGRFLLSLDHVDIAATLPLRAGAEFRERQRRIVVDQVIQQDQVVSLRVRRVTTASIFHSTTLPRLSFYLRNRDTAEAVAGSENEVIGVSASAGLAMLFGVSSHSSESGSGFDVTNDLIRFPDTYVVNPNAFDISAEWLSRAELLIVQTTAAGSVTRAVEIPRFEIAATPQTPAR